MTEQISFIHAADLHLDSPFQGLAHTPEHIFAEIQASTFTALDRLVQTAVDKQVDFVLLAGDLFDNEKQSLKAQVRLRRAFETLAQYNIYVYLSYGNHDFINGVHHPVTYPDNVFIFTDEQVTYFTYEKNQQRLANIYGFSYENRAVYENKAEQFQVKERDVPFHIAMLHGSLHSNTEHDVYAPFYIRDLTDKDFDYWALGHIHQRQILKDNPYIIYPGNTQGRSRKEQGEKGCYHVTLSQTGASSVSFIPLQAIRFHTITVDVSDCTEIHQLENEIQQALKTSKEMPGPQLIQLHLTSDAAQLKQWEMDGYLEEMMDLINETWIDRKDWRYIYRCMTESMKVMDETLYHGEHFIGELLRHFTRESVRPFMKELYDHKQARKYLYGVTPEEESAIKEKAKQLLVAELVGEGGE